MKQFIILISILLFISCNPYSERRALIDKLAQDTNYNNLGGGAWYRHNTAELWFIFEDKQTLEKTTVEFFNEEIATNEHLLYYYRTYYSAYGNYVNAPHSFKPRFGK